MNRLNRPSHAFGDSPACDWLAMRDERALPLVLAPFYE
jgi:hypothetical protein